MIKVTPVKKQNIPGYPDRDDVSRDRALLLARPERWKSRSMAAALAAIIPLAAAGCSAEDASMQPTPAGTPAPSPEPGPTQYVPVKLSVPLFEHGEGYGSFGCVSIVPPAFITEAEASELFNRIALEYGLTFTSGRQIKIGKVETSLYPNDTTKAASPANGKMDLSLDGYHEALGIAYEFVSTDDITAMQVPPQGYWVSVDTYGVKDAASLLLGEINDEPSAPTTAVFYDPCLSYTDIAPGEEIRDMQHEEYLALAGQANMRELEQQIRDFFEWLKAEGIL